MNRRHIHDDYPLQDLMVNNVKNHKKGSRSGKQYFSNPEIETNNNENNISIRCVDNINTESNHLIGNLEEFGLSQYEARAYFTMIGKGSASASEIAYYSHLPRTKIYPTLKKLEKKGLSIISQQKPLICSAINPIEAFEENVVIQEQKLKNMKRVIDKLQEINDKNNYLKGLEERKYFILDPKSTFQQISTLLENSRNTIIAFLDVWGLRLISECKSLLMKAISKGIKVKFLISNQCIGSEDLSFLPNEILIKVGNVFSNIILIDSSNMINIDGGNGKAALFTSIDILGFSYMKIFEEEWKKALEIKNSNKAESLNQLKAIRIVKFIEDFSCFSTSQYLYSTYLSNLSSLENNNTKSEYKMSSPASTYPLYYSSCSTTASTCDTNSSSSSDIDERYNRIEKDRNDKDTRFGIYERNPEINTNKNYVSLINILEKYGITLIDFTIEELVQIFDLSLKMNFSGELKYDRDNNILSIHSRGKNKSVIIVTILLGLYFVSLEYEIDITPKVSGKYNEVKIDTFHIKFSKSGF